MHRLFSIFPPAPKLPTGPPKLTCGRLTNHLGDGRYKQPYSNPSWGPKRVNFSLRCWLFFSNGSLQDKAAFLIHFRRCLILFYALRFDSHIPDRQRLTVAFMALHSSFFILMLDVPRDFTTVTGKTWLWVGPRVGLESTAISTRAPILRVTARVPA